MSKTVPVPRSAQKKSSGLRKGFPKSRRNQNSNHGADREASHGTIQNFMTGSQPAANISYLVGTSSRDIHLEGRIHLNSSQELPMHVHMNTTLGELFRNPKTSETAKELTAKYISAMNVGEESSSEAASEAITEEMTEAMTDSMPLRALVSFGGYSREELTEIIEKLNKLV